ncbi:AAA ATPase [Candidatus Mancarchaeum acidiphilum]|uniref:AAA ATPase n=1 Tax=Candidatus Mancarchaeum acidiphilum TaxID=1920749 RepID=A0A218NP68_9ARCH|nr:DUF87 domain-containing protein [Candidatus Mancarchaeum acidiphilum]ASI14255.1 AAA ATPase [Candidatus Mancarchaeum acidiphilum]
MIYKKFRRIFGFGLCRKRSAKSENIFALDFGKKLGTLHRYEKVAFSFYGKSSLIYEYGWKNADGSLILDMEKQKNLNILISGASGSGKSTLLKDLLIQMKDKVPILLLDPNGEHKELVELLNGTYRDSDYSGINPFGLDGISVNDRISELFYLFSTVLNLGSHQSYRLNSILRYVYRNKGVVNFDLPELPSTPNMYDLLKEINTFIDNSRSKPDSYSLENMKNKFELINRRSLNDSSFDVKSLLKGTNGINLAKLNNKNLRFIYLHELFSRIYQHMHSLESKGGTKLYIVIDEADTLLDEDIYMKVLSKFFEEGRKYGFGIIAVTHESSSLNKQIIANSNLTLSFQSKEPTELNYLSNIFSGSINEKNNVIKAALSSLNTNEFIIHDPVSKGLFKVKGKSYNEISKSIFNSDFAGYANLLYRYAKYPVELNSLLTHLPLESISYGLKNGIISKYLYKGKLYIMANKSNLSIEHEISVNEIMNYLDLVRVRNFKGTGRGKPDIVAYYNGFRIAVEYETGKKNFGSSKRMIEERIKHYSAVIVVVHEKSYQYYRDYLKLNDVHVVPSSNLQAIESIIKSIGG